MHTGVCTCSHAKRSSLVSLKGDPTRTLSLRRLWVNQFRARYGAILSLANDGIIKKDIFGLKENPLRIAARYQEPFISDAWKDNLDIFTYGQFAGLTAEAKIAAFDDWMRSSTQTALFSRSVTGQRFWYDSFIVSAYKHGSFWARQQLRRDPELLRKLGLSVDDIPVDDASVSASAFKQPGRSTIGTSSETIGATLESIDAATRAQISREIAEGLLLGENPRKIARRIADRIKSVGIHRATLLARTEVIRTHHLASIQAYEEFGVDGVQIIAEWNTAGDGRVCELCAPLDGKRFSLAQVRGMIPVHPQCRCGIVPVVLSDEETEEE